MPELPYDQFLQAELGTLIAVFGIVLLVVIGLTVALVGVPLMRLLGRIADNTQDAQRNAQDAQDKANAAQLALTNAGTALAAALAENTRELKAQTLVLTDLRGDFKAQIEASDKVVLSSLAAHDALVQEAVKRIEGLLAGLRDEIASGQRAQRAEVTGKLDLVLAEVGKVLKELSALRPPPTPPTASMTLVPPETLAGAA